MNSETRNCQNCKNDFTIEQDDFSFYEKMKVPPPTLCAGCRQQRRYAWRNERSLTKTVCGMCSKNILSAYRVDHTYPVYCHNCWMSDSWDPMDYGQDYDFSKPFFEQFKELFDRVPKLNLFQINSTNSDYSNIVRDCKDVYLSYSIVGGEDVHYSKNVDKSRQIIDCLCINDCESCFNIVYGANNYNVIYSVIVRSCLNSAFLFDCVGCSNCFMSSNLRNKQYVYKNREYSKDEYNSLMAKIDLGNFDTFSECVIEFEEMKLNAIHRFADIFKSVDSTGNALGNTKNAKNCFEAYDMENVKYVNRCFAIKDSMDVNNTGIGSELVYEYASGGARLQRVVGCVAALNPLSESYYSGWCGSSSSLFGCFGIRNKKFCILNKQYTEEEYKNILPKIIKHMSDMPYVGNNNRVYKFGEFFPIELSPFVYNGSVAQEHFILTDKEIKDFGYNLKNQSEKNYKISKQYLDIPNPITEIEDSIVNEIIGCAHKGDCLHQCTTAFKITHEELSFYRKMNLPLPRSCPNCRHYKRLEYRNPWKLWLRACMNNGCHNEFQTSYAPDRPERVYCESCYQKEVL